MTNYVIIKKFIWSCYTIAGIPDSYDDDLNPEESIGNHHKNCENSTEICQSYDKPDRYSELILPEDPYLKNYIWKKQCLAYAVWYLAESSNSYQLYQRHFEMVSFFK